MLRRRYKGSLIAAALFVAPHLFMRVTTPMETVENVQSAEAAIVFGAIVRSGRISPLHAERLNTAVALLNAEKVDTIVVSNAPEAARVMREYLITQGVAAEKIEVDPTAIRTPDSCIFESQNGGGRHAILISQRFHLPRIALHCAPYDFERSYVFADQTDRAPMPWHRVAVIRTKRFLRECALSWSILLGLYPSD